MPVGQSSSRGSTRSDATEGLSPQRDASTTRSSTNSIATSHDMGSLNQPTHVGAPANAHLSHIPRDLGSLVGFQNALLVHQKRLKVNSAQMFRTAATIDRLIADYHTMISTHLNAGGINTGPSGADQRKGARTRIALTIKQYDHLIEARRRTLEEHGASLELASEIAYLRRTDKLLEAINLQIAAAEDLGQRLEARKLKTGWKAFKQSSVG